MSCQRLQLEAVMPDKALERTVIHRGCTARA